MILIDGGGQKKYSKFYKKQENQHSASVASTSGKIFHT